jgi:hypothetical protein
MVEIVIWCFSKWWPFCKIPSIMQNLDQGVEQQTNTKQGALHKIETTFRGMNDRERLWTVCSRIR